MLNANSLAYLASEVDLVQSALFGGPLQTIAVDVIGVAQVRDDSVTEYVVHGTDSAGNAAYALGVADENPLIIPNVDGEDARPVLVYRKVIAESTALALLQARRVTEQELAWLEHNLNS